MTDVSKNSISSSQGNWQKRFPNLSTWLAALILSLAWSSVWLFAFFICTLLLGLSTGIISFIVVFWLSILAESYIRYMENTDFVAKYSKPLENNAKGDNRDFDGRKGSILFFMGMAGLITAGYGWHLMGGGITQFTPRPESVLFEGHILQDRAGIIVRGETCEFYPSATNIKSVGSTLEFYIIMPDGVSRIVRPSACPQEYKISNSEAMVLSGLDDPSRQLGSVERMIKSWKQILSSWVMLFSLLFAILLRTLIYKRSAYSDVYFESTDT